MPKGTPLPQPRTWLRDDPDHNKFGRSKPVRWKASRSKSDRALVAAAITQHEFAKAINATKTSKVTIAAHTGITVDQVRRILRGEAHLTLAYMRLIAVHAGLDLNPSRPTDPRR